MKKKIPLICLISCLGLGFLGAEEGLSPTGAVLSSYEVSWLTEPLIVGTGALVYGSSFLVSHYYPAPLGSANPYEIGQVNPFDSWAARPFSMEMDIASDVTFFLGLASPAVLGVVADWAEVGKVALMYGEALLWTQGVKELMKASVVRYRPYSYFPGSYDAGGLISEKKSLSIDEDAANSFFSGHASLSFMAATFTTVVFAEYFPGNPWGWAVGTLSYSLALTTTSLRVAGGNHFPSDVIAGAAVGTLIGWLVPFLHTLGDPLKRAIPRGEGEPPATLAMTLAPGTLGASFQF